MDISLQSSIHQRRVHAIGAKEEVAKEIEDNLYTKWIKNLLGIFRVSAKTAIISFYSIVEILSEVALYQGITDTPKVVGTTRK